MVGSDLFIVFSYVKLVLATLVRSKVLQQHLHFSKLLQTIFCAYIFVFLLLS